MTTRSSLVQRLPAPAERMLRLGRNPTGALERHRIIRRLAADPTTLPTRDDLSRLKNAWGGGGVADVDYLDEVCNRASKATEPILECGSGLTTLLMGIYAQVPVWALEEADRWAKRMRAALRWYRINGVNVTFAPLRNYDGFDWYSLPTGLPDRFGLVVCDGPIAHHKPGTPRYGLVPVMLGHLAPGAVIILDDAHRATEVATLERWGQEGLLVAVPESHTRAFAVVTVPKAL